MLVSRVLSIVLVLAPGALAQPRTHKVINSFPSPHGAAYTNGIAFMRGELWVGAGLGPATIYRVDAYTGAVLGSFAGPTTSSRGFTHDGGFLWVTSWSDNTVYRCLDQTGQVITSFQAFLGTGRPDGITWDGALLLISDETNQIHWFTPTGTPLRSVTVPPSGSFNPRGLAWDGSHVYAGYQSTGRIRRHEPGAGAVVLDLPSPSGSFQQGLAWGDWHLWSTGGFNAVIHQIDVGPPYLELVGTMSFPNSVQFRLTDAQNQTGDIAVVLLSLTGTAGFPVGNITVPLTLDPLTQLCLVALPAFSATVDAAGIAQTPLFAVPPMSVGITFWGAAVTLRAPNITSVTDPIRFKSQ